tara:strand:- start:659 stop:874 length:216 start_codon:yes stop_codon:yes gene_type:complete
MSANIQEKIDTYIQEKGSAGINVELSNGVITVRHSEADQILHEWTAREGDWNKIFKCIYSLEKSSNRGKNE